MSTKWERRIDALMKKGFSREGAIENLRATREAANGTSVRSELGMAALRPDVSLVPVKVVADVEERAALADAHAVSNRVRHLIVARPEFWDIRVFPTVLADEILKRYDRRQDIAVGFSLPGQRLQGPGVFDNLSERFGAAVRTIANLHVIVPQVTEALGPAGVPADIPRLVHLARTMAKVYEFFLDWTLSMRSAVVDDEMADLFRLSSDFGAQIASDIEDFSQRALAQVESLAADDPPPGTVIQITLELREPNVAPLQAEMERVSRLIARRRLE